MSHLYPTPSQRAEMPKMNDMYELKLRKRLLSQQLSVIDDKVDRMSRMLDKKVSCCAGACTAFWLCCKPGLVALPSQPHSHLTHAPIPEHPPPPSPLRAAHNEGPQEGASKEGESERVPWSQASEARSKKQPRIVYLGDVMFRKCRDWTLVFHKCAF